MKEMSINSNVPLQSSPQQCTNVPRLMRMCVQGENYLSSWPPWSCRERAKSWESERNHVHKRHWFETKML